MESNESSQLQLLTSSPYTWYYLSVILDLKELFNFNCQSQEEAGSAGGQPASNKADTYTVRMSGLPGCSFFITGKLYGFKNSLPISSNCSAYQGFYVSYLDDEDTLYTGKCMLTRENGNTITYSYLKGHPVEESSGETDRVRGITVRRNKQLRVALIESAWYAIRIDPSLLDSYQALTKRNEGHSGYHPYCPQVITKASCVPAWLATPM